jgi:hypothetical protein
MFGRFRGNTSTQMKGDTITFGDYQWLVLDVQRDRLLLLSKYLLDLFDFEAFSKEYWRKANERFNESQGWDDDDIDDDDDDVYNDDDYRFPTYSVSFAGETDYGRSNSVGIKWVNSILRGYLNNVFYNRFNQADRNKIIKVTNENKNNPWFGEYSGGQTTDYVFLLSLDEVVRYFGDSGQLAKHSEESKRSGSLVIRDKYNDNRIAKLNDDTGGAAEWWLRSPGDDDHRIATVDKYGLVLVRGHNAHESYCVRPAMWVKR